MPGYNFRPSYTDLLGLLLFSFDGVAAGVGGVLGLVVVLLLRLRGVHHGDECHAEVHTQAVDVEETEERQHRHHQPARRELCAGHDTPYDPRQVISSSRDGRPLATIDMDRKLGVVPILLERKGK